MNGNYFNSKLQQLGEIEKTPAAALLKTSMILRDDQGNFVLMFRYSFHAEKILQHKQDVAEILSRVYLLDHSVNVFVGVIGEARSNMAIQVKEQGAKK